MTYKAPLKTSFPGFSEPRRVRFQRINSQKEKRPSTRDEQFSLVTSRIFGWNSLENDLITLYMRLVELGMEYRDGEVYLADLEELENETV